MGYYIQTAVPKCKAEYILREYDAIEVKEPSQFEDVPAEFAIICVVDNGPFEAAAYIYCTEELTEFQRPDGRPKRWLLMDRGLAEDLAGFRK